MHYHLEENVHAEYFSNQICIYIHNQTSVKLLTKAYYYRRISLLNTLQNIISNMHFVHKSKLSLNNIL